jgi:FkbM family methyltransferase
VDGTVSRVRERLARIRVAVAHRLDPRTDPGPSRASFAQEGEDLVLDRFLGGRTGGFFVDVGAHHPSRFSNTRHFAARGWHGINVEADPALLAAFHEQRPDDVNLNCGVGLADAPMRLHVFNDPALNTFDEEWAADRARLDAYWVESIVQVPIRRLDAILDEHVPDGTRIGFLSVDAEGLDLEVLQSNAWDRHRPEFVLAECVAARSLGEVADDPVARYLSERGYVAVGKTLYTVIFQDAALLGDRSVAGIGR